MNLAEILVFTDIRQLHQMAAHYGCECNPHSKNELITSLLQNLRRKQTVADEVERLTPDEAHFLFLLFFDKRMVVSLEDLMAKTGVVLHQLKEKKQEQGRKLIANALRRGWIFPAKNKPIGQYQVPADIREPYIREWISRWKLTQPEEETEVPAYRDEGHALVDDCYRFLSFLGKEPVPLTGDGGMYKRYQTQLLSFLSVKEEPLAPQKWRFGYGLHFDQYPDRFSLLYDFCYYHRWIKEEAGTVQLTEQGAALLSQPPSPTLYDDVIRFWQRVYKRAVPNLPMLIQLIPWMSGGKWVSQESFKQILLPWLKPFYYDEPEAILVQRVLKMMVHLGLLKVGQRADEEWVYASTESSLTWLQTYNGFTETIILLK
ncbi:hypothetical protein ACTID9_13600 [Brevibacillus fluminis]|uniref:hypothetical protein n=1 Tax=Brevibacillus fluminis TaxID=511487 RepID=UPI003F8C24C2